MCRGFQCSEFLEHCGPLKKPRRVCVVVVWIEHLLSELDELDELDEPDGEDLQRGAEFRVGDRVLLSLFSRCLLPKSTNCLFSISSSNIVYVFISW